MLQVLPKLDKSRTAMSVKAARSTAKINSAWVESVDIKITANAKMKFTPLNNGRLKKMKKYLGSDLVSIPKLM